MKKIFLMIVILYMPGCTEKEEVKIEFCEKIDANGLCIGSGTEFLLGSEVHVRCKSNNPFPGKQVTGSIYVLEEDNRFLLGTRFFELSPGDTYLTHNIPFNEFGNGSLGRFLVEFTDDRGRILASKELTIQKK